MMMRIMKNSISSSSVFVSSCILFALATCGSFSSSSNSLFVAAAAGESASATGRAAPGVVSDHELRQEFVNAMEHAGAARKKMRKLNQFHNEFVGDANQPAELTSRLLQIARPVKNSKVQLQEVGDQQFHRLLNDEQGDDGNYYENAVNLTEYALKYIGCQNVHTFSDDLAQDGNDASGVLQMNHFVMFRLCPRDSCSNYNEYGCNAGFGDYLITMEEYLDAMTNYFFAGYEEYCQTCYQCMTAAENAAQGNNNGDDDGANGNDDGAAANYDDAYNYAGDDGYNYNNRGRQLDYNYYNNYGNGDDGNYNNDDANNGDDDGANGDDDGAAANNGGQYQCEYYDVCQRYKSACRDYNARATKYQDYFYCNKFNLGNNYGYMGPHCRADGKTIGIAIFEDQYCNEFQSDLTDMSDYLGIDFSDKYMKVFHSDHCYSCLASVSTY